MIQSISKIIKKYRLDKKFLNNQAVTSVVSVMLVMMIFFGSIAIIFFWGLPAIDESKINAQRESSFANLDIVDSAIDELLQDGVGGYQTVSIQSEENLGSIYIDSESERFIAMYTRDNSFDLNVSGLDDNNESFKVEAYKDGGHIDVNDVTMYWMNETCFLSGTKVLMSDGSYKNIEDIEIGEYVKSYDVKTDSIIDCKVTNVLSHSKKEMSEYYLLINDFLRVTPNHKFYSKGEWIFANDLKPGDFLFTNDKINFEIESVEKIFEKEKSYDLTVENNHNYFVSLDNNIAVLVHNSDVLDQYQDGYTEDVELYDYYRFSQSFIPERTPLSKVSLYLKRTSSPIPQEPVVCSIYHGDEEGDLLSEALAEAEQIGTSYSWIDFVFSEPIELIPGETYYITISSRTRYGDGYYYYGINDKGGYDGGLFSYSYRFGSWMPDERIDGCFRTYAQESTNNPPSVSIDAVSDPAGPSDVSSFTGSSSDSDGTVAGVYLSIQNLNNNDFWCGGSWQASCSLSAGMCGLDLAAKADDGFFDSDSESWIYDCDAAGVTWSDGVSYRVTAESKDDDGDCSSSDSVEFTYAAGNNPPDKPTYPYPESDDTNISIDSDISWTATDPDNNYATSAIYFSDPATPDDTDSENEVKEKLIENIALNNYNQNTSSTSFDPGHLEYNKKYFWVIIVWDDEGLSTQGPIWNFTTSEEEIIPPDTPLKPYTIGKYDEYYNETLYTFETVALENDLHYSWDFTGNKKSDTGWLTADGNKTSYSWSKSGFYIIRVKAKNDTTGAVSEWSEPLPIRIIEKNRKPENYKKMLSSKNGEIIVHPPGSPQKIEITSSPVPKIKGTVMIELFNDSYPVGNPGGVSFAVIYVLDLGSMTQVLNTESGEYDAILQNDGIYASKPNSFMWNNPFFVDYIKNASMIHFIQIRNQEGKESVAGKGLFSFKINYLNLNLLDNAERKTCNLKMQIFGENKDLWVNQLTNKNIFAKQAIPSDFPDTYSYQVSDEANFVVKSSIIRIDLERIT